MDKIKIVKKGIYLKEEFAASPGNSHPNNQFSVMAYNLFCKRIVDVIENDGKKTNITGEAKSGKLLNLIN